MVAEYEVHTEELDAAAAALQRYPQIARDVLTTSMSRAVMQVSSEVKRRTPVYMGRLVGSIGGRVEAFGGGISPLGGEIRGIVDTPVDYALPVEVGRRPGSWPPIDKIARWCHLVLGEEGAAGAVAAKIFHQGTEPRAMFARGWVASKPWVKNEFKRALREIVQRLARG